MQSRILVLSAKVTISKIIDKSLIEISARFPRSANIQTSLDGELGGRRGGGSAKIGRDAFIGLGGLHPRSYDIGNASKAHMRPMRVAYVDSA